MLVKDAPTIWNSLRGIICVYKPADEKVSWIRKTIINKICAELNQLECRPIMKYVAIEGNPSKELSVVVKDDLSDDPSVIGPRYQSEDLRCSWSNYLGINTSGVLLLGLKDGTRQSAFIRQNRPTRAYKICGTFGQSTDNYYKDGNVVERTTFKHIKIANIEKLLSYMQAAHQKKMFELCGVDMKTQAAYDLAVNGLVRPLVSKIPVIYGIKCVKFDSPHFTIEIQCVNEYEMYLKALIHEIGMKLSSSAYCTAIQCMRHSYFTLDNALLRRQWTLENIVKNLGECNEIIENHQDLLDRKSAALQ